MDIHEWLKTKIRRPLNTYPLGKLLPFKAKNGYLMKLLGIGIGNKPVVLIGYYTYSGQNCVGSLYLTFDNKPSDNLAYDRYTVDWNTPNAIKDLE